MFIYSVSISTHIERNVFSLPCYTWFLFHIYIYMLAVGWF
jgi:hypothetical protein